MPVRIRKRNEKSARRIEVSSPPSPLSIRFVSETRPKQQLHQDTLQAYQLPSTSCKDLRRRCRRGFVVCLLREESKTKVSEARERTREGRCTNLLVLISPPGLFLSHTFSAFSSRLDLQSRRESDLEGFVKISFSSSTLPRQLTSVPP